MKLSPRTKHLGGLLALTLSGAFALAQSNPYIAANLGGVADWMRSHEFADITKQSRGFAPVNTPWDGVVALDETGHPLDDAGLYIMCCQPTDVEQGLSGVYRFSFDCAGTETPRFRGFDSSGQLISYERDPLTGRVHGEWFFPQGGDRLLMSFYKTQGGVRNMKIMRPGTTEDQVFMPTFVDSLRHFGAIRFMPWTKTNNSPAVRWSDRSTLEDASYRWRTGVPYELCVDLCNELQRDMWINVPHMADDNFVNKLAILIRDRLDPDLNVYVEYSNEVWNFMFEQADWNYDQGVLEAQNPASILRYDGVTDADTMRHRRIAKRTVEIGQQFANVFGPGSMNTRVRPVLAAQFGATWQFERMLSFIDGAYGPAKDRIYALAVAPYFNLGGADTRTLTPPEVLDALQGMLDRLPTSYQYEHLAAMTAWHGLRPFMAYEGGPDTTGSANVAAKRDAMYDPRIGSICTQYLRQWHEAGGGLFMWFHAGSGSWINDNGSWSLTESLAIGSPKYSALQAMAQQPVPPTLAGVPFPGPVDARRHLNRNTDWETRPNEQMGPSDTRDYLIRVSQPGIYNLRLLAAPTVASADIWVGANGAQVGTLTLTNPAWPTPMPRQWWGAIPVQLSAGLNTIRLRSTVGYQFAMWELNADLVSLTCDPIDFNRNGVFPEEQDVSDFLSALAGAPCSFGPCDLDFNNNSVFPEEQDVISFLTVLAGGPCE